jgi:hypothetical protein
MREMGRLPSPPPTLAVALSLSESGQLEQAFREAGFVTSSVAVSPVPVPREFDDVADGVEAMRASSPARDVLDRTMSGAEQAYYWAELGRRLQPYVQADGRCVVPGEALIAVGAK